MADASGRVTFWNEAAARMFGHAAEDLVGHPIERLMPERFRPEHGAGMRRMRSGGASRLAGKTVEVIGLRADGAEFPIEITIASWPGKSGIEFGAVIQDVGERRQREAQLARLAHGDALTGLPNRSGLQLRIEGQLEAAGAATLLLCDLKRLKEVNDTLGHAIGDALLQTAALRLRAWLPDDGIVARFSDDEFAVLTRRAMSGDEMEDLARAVIALFQVPFELDVHRIHVDVSIGVASLAETRSGAERLVVQADLALLQAKKGLGSGHHLYGERLAGAVHARRELNDELRQATQGGEWQLYYQPQVRLDDRVLTGVEALLRWNHPRRGLLGPAEFMPLLERHFGAERVGLWILNEACRQLRAWRDGGFVVPRVAVNLFASQFRAKSLEADILAALARNGLQPTDLELEITEKIALGVDDQAEAIVRSLAEKGLEIAFDDFGTGFASLSTLKQFPVTRLKIDRSFVHDVAETTSSAAIVSAIVSIGRGLGIDVIAEGIETERQRRQLMGLGCVSGQGYLFGHPMPAHLVEARSRTIT